jgi:hypothetical protein
MSEKKGPWRESPALDRLPPIFRRCLDRECARFDLGHPFAEGGFLYATNGVIVVRVARPEGWEYPDAPKAPANVGLAFDLPRPGDFLAKPTPLPRVRLDDCSACQGRCVTPARTCQGCHDKDGRTMPVRCFCPDCQGRHECGGCYGLGVIGGRPCHYCLQSGMAEGESKGDAWDGGSVMVAPGFILGRRFVALLARFGATVHLPIDWSENNPCRFVVGEVEGRLMPVRPNRGGN